MFGWVIVEASTFVSSSAWASADWMWWAVLVAGLCVYRLTEIIVWYLRLLFDPAHSLLAGYERNLLFVVLNLGELTLLCGCLLQAADSRARGPVLLDSFSTVTLLAMPRLGGAVNSAVVVTTVVVSLVLFAGGLAMIVARIAEKFHPCEHEGPRD